MSRNSGKKGGEKKIAKLSPDRLDRGDDNCQRVICSGPTAASGRSYLCHDLDNAAASKAASDQVKDDRQRLSDGQTQVKSNENSAKDDNVVGKSKTTDNANDGDDKTPEAREKPDR